VFIPTFCLCRFTKIFVISARAFESGGCRFLVVLAARVPPLMHISVRNLVSIPAPGARRVWHLAAIALAMFGDRSVLLIVAERSRKPPSDWNNRDMLSRVISSRSVVFPLIGCVRLRHPASAFDLSFQYEDFLYVRRSNSAACPRRVPLLNVGASSVPADERRRASDRASRQHLVVSVAKMPYEATLGAMKALAGRISKITGAYKGQPSTSTGLWSRMPESCGRSLAGTGARRPIPSFTLVTASPFDAAVHDAFGKLRSQLLPTYSRPDAARHRTLSRRGISGEYLDSTYQDRQAMPLYHSSARSIRLPNPTSSNGSTTRLGRARVD
jgi:hypothetical protein